MGSEEQYSGRHPGLEAMFKEKLKRDRFWDSLFQQRHPQTPQVSTTAPLLPQSNGSNGSRVREFTKGNINVSTCDDDYATVLIKAGYKEVLSGFDPNDLQGWGTYQKPCCGGGVGQSALYRDGKWHDPNCDTLKPPQTLPDYYGQGSKEPDYRVKPSTGGCECGSSAVGSDKHAYYCPLYTK